MMWKEAEQQSPPDESMDITDFGWTIQDDVPVPGVAERDPDTPQLRDVINWMCKVVRKKSPERSAAQWHAALTENTSPAPITATVVGKMAAAIPI